MFDILLFKIYKKIINTRMIKIFFLNKLYFIKSINTK
jgi:hypothetical protein